MSKALHEPGLYRFPLLRILENFRESEKLLWTSGEDLMCISPVNQAESSSFLATTCFKKLSDSNTFIFCSSSARLSRTPCSLFLQFVFLSYFNCFVSERTRFSKRSFISSSSLLTNFLLQSATIFSFFLQAHLDKNLKTPLNM